MAPKTISRRKLIRDSIMAAAGSTLFLSSSLKVFGKNKKAALTKVVLVRNKDVLNGDSLNAGILEKMLDDALLELISRQDVKAAWLEILKPEDILGIKTNVWENLHTPAQLEDILTKKAKSVGIDATNISVNDRGIRNDPVFKRSTALINVRPMRTHAWAGVGTLMKNYIMFTEKPSDHHPDSCADLATLYNLPQVKGKTRLNILVMLTPLFHGIGPHHFNKQFVWNYNGLLIGFDPVAVDSVGLRIIQAKRREYFQDDIPLNPPAKHIALADTRYHLGTADPQKIDLVKLGWKEDILI
jgi:hypothetical protein